VEAKFAKQQAALEAKGLRKQAQKEARLQTHGVAAEVRTPPPPPPRDALDSSSWILLQELYRSTDY
jgi:hypothetical protein